MNEIIMLVIGVALLVVTLGFVVWYMFRRNNPKLYKQRGKDDKNSKAVKAMQSFARSNNFRFIAPANLARKGEFANIDAIVVGYFGVLGVKSFGFNGQIYGSATEDKWVQISDKGERETFENPIKEAAADVRVIRDALFAAKLKKTPVEVLCVFTNSKAQLAVPRGTAQMKTKEFKKLLRKDKYLEDSGLDLDIVENAIRAALQ